MARDELSDGGRGERPLHVAIIMDGNGRWATERRRPRLAGHREGAEALRRIVEACPDLGVDRLTLYAFSTENWSRPAEEVSGLMNLFRRYIAREADDLARRGARVRFIGDRVRLAPDIRAAMDALEARTAHNDKLTLRIAMNYGGREEIAAAARALARKVAAGEIDADDIDEAAFRRAIDPDGDAEPDLLIRTAGEQRLSNFLTWQNVYSELVFVKDYWPDFTPAHLAACIAEFNRRERRFGGLPGVTPAAAE